jgi:hypothetical protein
VIARRTNGDDLKALKLSASTPALSPDGTRIAFATANGALTVAPTQTSAERARQPITAILTARSRSENIPALRIQRRVRGLRTRRDPRLLSRRPFCGSRELGLSLSNWLARVREYQVKKSAVKRTVKAT